MYKNCFTGNIIPTTRTLSLFQCAPETLPEASTTASVRQTFVCARVRPYFGDQAGLALWSGSFRLQSERARGDRSIYRLKNRAALYGVLLLTTLPGLFYCKSADYFTCLGLLLGFMAAVPVEERFAGMEGDARFRIEGRPPHPRAPGRSPDLKNRT